MKRLDALQGSLDLLVLTILLRRSRTHDCEIMAAVKEASNDLFSIEESSLYSAPHRMGEAGWVRAAWIKKESGWRARTYELIPTGKKHLAVEESRWQTTTSAINQVLRTV